MTDKPKKTPSTGVPSHEAENELIAMCIDDHSLACYMHPKLRKAIERLHRADENYQKASDLFYEAFEELRPPPIASVGE